MMKDLEPTLSAHLLGKARKFFLYPERRPTRGEHGLEREATAYAGFSRLLPWGSTFTVTSSGDLAKRFARDEVLIDEVYCRHLLSAIPDFVERTRLLVTLSLDSLPTGPPLAFMQEATRTYIAGFFRAAVALARAAVESALKQSITQRFGSTETELEHLVDFALRSKLISPEGHAAAGRVRTAGNKALHRLDAQLDAKEARSVVEDARSVILDLSSRQS